jgi:hypothetical protein
LIWIPGNAIFVVFFNKKLIIFCKIPYHYSRDQGTAVIGQ